MLDMVADECLRIDSRFLEPACGNGNFLAEVLRRKLSVVNDRYQKDPAAWERHGFVAVASLYGVELLSDNVGECRERLLAIVSDQWRQVCKARGNPAFLDAVAYVLSRNIQCGDALTMKTAAGKPITFSEWSLVFGDKVKRRDYRLCDLLENQEEVPSLFGADDSSWSYRDRDESGSLPAPMVAEFKPASIYEVAHHG